MQRFNLLVWSADNNNTPEAAYYLAAFPPQNGHEYSGHCYANQLGEMAIDCAKLDIQFIVDPRTNTVYVNFDATLEI